MADALGSLIRRTTVVLAACLALSWAVVQLFMTAGAPTLAEITGNASLAGFAPALFIAFWAGGTVAAGRYMDARGRMPGIRAGFGVCAAGCALLYTGTSAESLVPLLAGIAAAGAGAGAVNLARTGAADMYPKERRARGISFVLVGAAVGAILGPVVFVPLLAGSGTALDALAPAWVAATAIMLAGIALTFVVRVDPLDIGRRLGVASAAEPQLRPRATREILRSPNARTALLGAAVAQTVMTTMMSTTGLVLHGHGHEWTSLSITMSAHFLGMFGLVIFVGSLVDRIGRRRALAVGFAVLGAGVLMMLAEVELRWFVPALFAVGVGWNFAFVAATAILSDETQPAERAGVLGFADFVALAGAAAGAASAGFVLDRFGIRALVAFGVAAVFLPLLAAALPRRAAPPVAECEVRVP